MKKNILITMLILIVAMSVCTLTACGDGDATIDYNGEATLTLNFDKVYTGLEVSCPSAIITKVDDTHIKCEFQSLEPIEVVVSAEGEEPAVILLTYEDKKTGNITRDVTFTKRQCRMEIMLDIDENANIEPKIVGKDNIKVNHINSTKYELVSDVKIKEDIVLSLGDEYYDIPIDCDKLVYSLGNYGVAKGSFVALKKSDNKVVVESPCGVSLVSVDDTTLSYSVVADKQTVVEALDYYILIEGQYLSRVNASTLKDNLYNTLDVNFMAVNNSSIISLYGISFSTFDIDSFGMSGRSVSGIVGKRKFLEGDILSLTLSGDFRNGNINDVEHYYVVTAEDIATSKLHIKDNNIVNIGKHDHVDIAPDTLRKFSFKVYDNYGNLLDKPATITYNVLEGYDDRGFEIRKEHTLSTDGIVELPYMIDNVRVTYEADDNSTYMLGGNFWGMIEIYYEMYGEDTEILPVNLVMNHLYKKNIEYYDVVTKEVISTRENALLTEGAFEFVDNENEFEIVDKRIYNGRMLAFSNEYYKDDIITINVEKRKNAILHVTNMDKLRGYKVNMLYFECKYASLKNLRVYPNNGGTKLPDENAPTLKDNEFLYTYLSSDVGETYVYKCKDRTLNQQGIELVKFTVTIEPDLGEYAVINITIEDEPDEWQL